MIVSTDAVVLHAMKYSDTSKIVTLYTREYGKIKVVAKGARSNKSTFGSSLEPMTHSSVIFYKKEHKDLHLLSKSEIVTPMYRLATDGDKLQAGFAVIELLDVVMHSEEKSENIFQLVVQSLHLLDRSEKNFRNVFIAFAVHLFRHLGYELSLERCSRCDRSIETETNRQVKILFASGAYVCSHCAPDEHSDALGISIGAVRSLLHSSGSDAETLFRLEIGRQMSDEIIQLIQMYLHYHVPGARTLRSLAML
ncbi:MAG: DNA repair protein RecO [Ignavibacteriales bacterium]|nr:DNA repair protein RecO [Ignavibacteriales bacterium]